MNNSDKKIRYWAQLVLMESQESWGHLKHAQSDVTLSKGDLTYMVDLMLSIIAQLAGERGLPEFKKLYDKHKFTVSNEGGIVQISVPFSEDLDPNKESGKRFWKLIGDEFGVKDKDQHQDVINDYTEDSRVYDENHPKDIVFTIDYR